MGLRQREDLESLSLPPIPLGADFLQHPVCFPLSWKIPRAQGSGEEKNCGHFQVPPFVTDSHEVSPWPLCTRLSWSKSSLCLWCKTSGWPCSCQTLWPILDRQPTTHLDTSPHSGNTGRLSILPTARWNQKGLWPSAESPFSSGSGEGDPSSTYCMLTVCMLFCALKFL